MFLARLLRVSAGSCLPGILSFLNYGDGAPVKVKWLEGAGIGDFRDARETEKVGLGGRRVHGIAAGLRRRARVYSGWVRLNQLPVGSLKTASVP